MKEIIIKKQELLDLVWEKTVSHISESFNVPATVIRKTCIEKDIQLPPNGYWSKIKFKKPVPAKPILSKDEGSKEITLMPELKPTLRKGGASKRSNRNQFEKPDQLVVQVGEYLKNKKPSSNIDRYPGIVSSKESMLSNKVSPENIPRALDVMDIFVKITKAKGYIFETHYGKLILMVGKQDVEFSLREKFKRIKTSNDNLQSYKMVPTGKLSFEYKVRRSYLCVEDKVPLEEQISDIFERLEKHAIEWRRELEESWASIEEREKQQELERQLQAKKDQEFRRFKGLVKMALHWKLTELLNEYLHVVENKENQMEGLAWAK